MEKDMEFGEHGNQVQEEMCIPVSSPSRSPKNDSLKKSMIRTKTSAIAEKSVAIASPGSKSGPIVETLIAKKVATTVPSGHKSGPTVEKVIYRECQKNHARSIGGYAFDGCGEFLGVGEEGTLEAVICAACNCHRNFHRKEIDNIINMSSYPYQPWLQPQPPLHAYYHHVPPPPPVAGYHHHLVATTPVSQHLPLALPAASSGGFSREEDDILNPSSNDSGGRAKKRFRTKFTTEQNDKMLAFAEKLGWRIQKHDTTSVEQFCAQTGVKKQVLKVWMHNNKHTLGKKA